MKTLFAVCVMNFIVFYNLVVKNSSMLRTAYLKSKQILPLSLHDSRTILNNLCSLIENGYFKSNL